MSDSDLIRVYRHYLASVVHFHLAAAEAAGLGPTDYQAASLLDLDGPMRAGQLAEHLGLSAGAATRVVDRLVRAGIAERTTAGEDRRRILVRHTGHLPGPLTQVLEQARGRIGSVVEELDEHQRAGLRTYFSAATTTYLRLTDEHLH